MPWCRCDVLLALYICPLACLVASPCPPGCCCPRPGFLVLCESLGLRSLPRSVPLGISVLSVARNRLCDVDHLLGPFSGLQELSLSHNLLPRFPRGLPPSLESLLLQENRITYITSGSLRRLRNLTRLDLEDNRISAVQPGALLALGKLQILTLKGNRLTSLPLDLPPSLTHLDLSANCISSLDLPSLSALVNLLVLQINSNCLRTVPERAFDGLPRLRTVDLTDNLWVCECNILYLYRWLLSGGLKMATDLVCNEPLHLARRLLLNLSVASICPHVLQPQETPRRLHPSSAATEKQTRVSHENGLKLSERSTASSEARSGQDPSEPRVLHYSLEALSYEECLSLNKTQPVSSTPLSPTAVPEEEQRNTTGTQPWLSTQRDELFTRPQLSSTQRDSAVIISLLAVVCVLLALVMLAVLILLKKVLVRQQRVAPASNERSGG